MKLNQVMFLYCIWTLSCGFCMIHSVWWWTRNFCATELQWLNLFVQLNSMGILNPNLSVQHWRTLEILLDIRVPLKHHTGTKNMKMSWIMHFMSFVDLWNTARLASLWHLLLMQLKVVVKIEPSYCAQRFRFALQSRLYDILLNTLVYETYKLGEILGYD